MNMLLLLLLQNVCNRVRPLGLRGASIECVYVPLVLIFLLLVLASVRRGTLFVEALQADPVNIAL